MKKRILLRNCEIKYLMAIQFGLPYLSKLEVPFLGVALSFLPLRSSFASKPPNDKLLSYPNDFSSTTQAPLINATRMSKRTLILVKRQMHSRPFTSSTLSTSPISLSILVAIETVILSWGIPWIWTQKIPFDKWVAQWGLPLTSFTMSTNELLNVQGSMSITCPKSS